MPGSEHLSGTRPTNALSALPIKAILSKTPPTAKAISASPRHNRISSNLTPGVASALPEWPLPHILPTTTSTSADTGAVNWSSIPQQIASSASRDGLSNRRHLPTPIPTGKLRPSDRYPLTALGTGLRIRPMADAPVYNRKNPLLAKLRKKYDLTGASAEKHTAHYEIDLKG